MVVVGRIVVDTYFKKSYFLKVSYFVVMNVNNLSILLPVLDNFRPYTIYNTLFNNLSVLLLQDYPNNKSKFFVPEELEFLLF